MHKTVCTNLIQAIKEALLPHTQGPNKNIWEYLVEYNTFGEFLSKKMFYITKSILIVNGL